MAAARGWAAALAAGALLCAGCGDVEPELEMRPTTEPAPRPQQPLPAWEPPACARDPKTQPSADADERIRVEWGMTGHWRGLAKTSFGGPGAPETFVVDVTFAPDGHYQGHSLMPGYAAFYYGSDEDTPAKTWSLDFVSASSSEGGFGSIQIFFASGDVQAGQLDGILVSEDLSAMRFRFLPQWLGVAPLVYELRCEP